jgi:hypothetical protein
VKVARKIQQELNLIELNCHQAAIEMCQCEFNDEIESLKQKLVKLLNKHHIFLVILKGIILLFSATCIIITFALLLVINLMHRQHIKTVWW